MGLYIIGCRLYEQKHIQITAHSPNHGIYEIEWDIYNEADHMVIDHVEMNAMMRRTITMIKYFHSTPSRRWK